MNQYKNLGFKIEDFECVSIYDPKFQEYEHCLAGELGEIWPKGDGTYKAFKCARDKFEKVIYLKSLDIKKYRRLLKIPFRADDQILWANKPNKR